MRPSVLSVVVVNQTFAELRHLASVLAASGELSRYVSVTLDSHNSIQSRLRKLPLIGRRIGRELDKRAIPHNLAANQTRFSFETLIFDALGTGAAQLGGRLESLGDQIRPEFLRRRDVAISRTAAKVINNEDAIVAIYGSALEVFRKAQRVGGPLRVLDYPVAHHSYMQNRLRQDMQLSSSFASTMQGHNLSVRLCRQLDEEIRLAELILVGSEFVRCSFVESGVEPEKIRVIPYGVDSKSFYVDRSKRVIGKNCRFLFVGQMTQRKGIGYLLEAFKSFPDDDCELILIGGRVKSLVPLEQSGARFQYFGRLSRSDVISHMQSADVFVLPSLVEGMPLVVLEAMSCGLPVISCRSGADQIVRDGIDGLLVEAGSAEALRDAMLHLANNSDVRARMGKAARTRAEEFSWSRYANRVREAIIETLGAG